ncbi:hypothetical protein VNO78_21508 [Psophocarpus tetragonolobus]|uniref:Uncharacterized protein n=1 Tax=Psophocarpus tetragonolobus TaxID=3891 RepID=A0AAN9SGQ0_PSOTE
MLLLGSFPDLFSNSHDRVFHVASLLYKLDYKVMSKGWDEIIKDVDEMHYDISIRILYSSFVSLCSCGMIEVFDTLNSRNPIWVNFFRHLLMEMVAESLAVRWWCGSVVGVVRSADALVRFSLNSLIQ